MDFDVTVRAEPQATVVAPAGDLDIQTAPALTDALNQALDAEPRRVVLDLRAVGFLDSSALGVMVGAHKRARAQQSSVVLVARTESVLRLFRITRLTELFPIYPTLDEALAD